MNMRQDQLSAFARVAVLVLLGASLSACGNTMSRLSQVGDAPHLNPVQNPATIPGNQPVQTPMPPPVAVRHNPNSLWRTGSRHFLKDQRAAQVGDIVTVNIEIQDSAEISNTTTRSRTSAEASALPSFLGFESQLSNFLPDAVNPASLVDLSSSGSSEGSGTVNRDETIDLSVAAIVTQILPNGNMVIAGRQEIRVNYELRELQVAGIIRPEDIASTNTIEFNQIAEARIAYGGRGQISDLQQPRYGQQVFDIIWPF